MTRQIAAMVVLALLLPSASVGARWVPVCSRQRLPTATAKQRSALTPDLKRDLDALLRDVVQRKVTPSAALLVAHRGKVIYRNAAGRGRVDSIFDLASVTKVIATTTAVMQLIDQGKLKLDTRIGRFLPTLPAAKRGITIKQLLLHTAGLPSVVYRGALTDGRRVILDRIWKAKLKTIPGAERRYSDVGFILLGEVVAAASGMSLDKYARRFIFRPLGMCDTGFAPPKTLRSRLISPWPTHKNPTGENSGVVYDPLGARMAGVAGHAGLFSTLEDIARFGQALLDHRKGVVSAKVLRRFLQPQRVPKSRAPLALGWVLESKQRPQQLSGRAFGHGGFTGTALWIDPSDQLVVVLLTNRTYYEPTRSISPLRRRIHAVIHSSLLRPPRRAVRTGLDRLVARRFKSLRGKRLGLVTNRTAVDAKQRWIVDLVDEAGIKLVALFTPEHGLAARVDRHVKDNVYTTTSGRRVKLYSLFGPRRKPTRKTLSGIDVLVFDVAAVGVRYYTYISTMALAMEAAARQGIEFVVLDRPNPIGGEKVAGPVSTDRRRTSTNYHPLPVRYGMTMGELARMFNAERRIKARLRVVEVRHWRRRTTFDRQGLPWVNPSPNIRSWRQAMLYAAVGLLEGTNLAVGRGTDSPFVWLGAPWIDGAALARRLNRQKLPGVYFVPENHRPRSSRYRGKHCAGVRLVLFSPARFQPVRTGVEIARALRERHADRWQTEKLYRLVRHPPTVEAIRGRKRIRKIVGLWRPGLRRFLRQRARYLLYR